MKILFVHNNYASNNSGEEHASQGLADLLAKNGHVVEWYRKSSDIINNSFKMKIAAFLLGVYNPTAVKQLKKKILDFQPDIIQIQNVYPFISPAVIRLGKKLKIPIVMRCPNYRLFCPTGLHLDGKGNICEQCLSGVRELNCVIKNCENNRFKSLGYALRNFIARKYWGITKIVDAYIVQSEFQKQKFIENGIPSEKLVIVPGLTPKIIQNFENEGEPMVSYVGRVSEEKGIREFIEAARQLPDIGFKVIGSYSKDYQLLKESSSSNVEWMGFVSGNKLDQLYSNSRVIVVPGKWYEGFPNVITRAMKHGKPVITSDLGAMASIIDHKENGLLVPPGDAEALAQAINQLYYDKSLCKKYGLAGLEKANALYTEKSVYNNLLNVYKSVI
ncbi:glycosyltransferase family 4 protein [Winogradskyella sp.]|uniref:glycosyltransferase family 4 protein n=1 Tax=Winogradskyella sp. TaxID=1883156 RepID=UPI0026126508|nr:glycosyltransferase family 4 protein [Winogradskyella sp.]